MYVFFLFQFAENAIERQPECDDLWFALRGSRNCEPTVSFTEDAKLTSGGSFIYVC